MIKKIIYTVLFLAALISLSFAEISQVWRTGQTTSYSAGDDGALQKGAAWPSPRFTLNGDGTVTDKLTGLIWAQNAGTPTVGTCTGGALNWTQALSYVACLNGVNYLGHNDWRLPNRKELMSLIDYSRSNPALVSEASNTNYFIGMTTNSTYWSGSPNTGWTSTGGTAWRLSASTGVVNNYPMSFGFYAWPVRGASLVSEGPRISLFPASYNFGLVPMGSTSAPKEFLLSNAGTQDLIVSGITMTSPLFSVTPGGTSPCASMTPTLAPGGSCTLTATFTPASDGYMFASLYIHSNDPATPVLYAQLSGTGAYALSVLKAGTGAGTVTSTPAGISCGSDCTELYPGGTLVTLTTGSLAGSVFAGWSGGGCSGTGPCTVTMNAPIDVIATFNSVSVPTISLSPSSVSFGNVPVGSTSAPKQFTLSNSGAADLIVSGITVTSSQFSVTPGGTSPCASLTPTLAPGGSCTIAATFTPTSGGYASTVMMITSNDPVKANLFATLSGYGAYPLTVLKAGTGTGTVYSNPAGINCGQYCSALYPGGTLVTLSTGSLAGSIFAGWSGGGCSGTGTCTVTMNASTEVTATFNLAPIYNLTVSTSGTGAGTVTSVPVGISCPGDCTEAYAANTSVTLTAASDASSIFTGWVVSGAWSTGGGSACTGTGPCTVVMTADKSVLAQFARRLTVTSPNGGETMRKGATTTITWTYDASAGSFVRIELLKGGVLNRTIASSAPIGSGGSGAYTWNIPKNQGTGSNFQIRVTSTSNSVFTDMSDGYFSITK